MRIDDFIFETEVRIDSSKRFQTIDGFGVNINSKYWNKGNLIKVLESLISDLGTTLFRLDAYGNSNWIDPDNSAGPKILGTDYTKDVFKTQPFIDAKEMCLWLNSKGIEPYINMSGIVPTWMCKDDGKTLVDFDSFAVMCADYIQWLVESKVKFTLFGPLNETDLGPPEGPFLDLKDYVKVLTVLSKELDRRGLSFIRFVVPEFSSVKLLPDFLSVLSSEEILKNKIAAFATHTYTSSCDYNTVFEVIKKTPFKDIPLWMTEFGDLDQSGEREWFFSWKIFERIMEFLEAGYSAGLYWDAFDNYHDHDKAWTSYGLFRNSRNIFTPKKRFYVLKHIFKFILPGFQRLETITDFSGLKIQAYQSKDKDSFTLVGFNSSLEGVWLNLKFTNFKINLEELKMHLYRTTIDDNCVFVGDFDGSCKWSSEVKYDKITVSVEPHSIFTLTTL